MATRKSTHVVFLLVSVAFHAASPRVSLVFLTRIIITFSQFNSLFSKQMVSCCFCNFSVTMHSMIALSHISAYKFWRAYDGHNFAVGEILPVQQSSPSTQVSAIVEFAQDNGLQAPDGTTHISTVPKATPPRHRHITAHGSTRDFKSNYWTIEGRFPVANPELTFLHMASMLSHAALVALGCELCSQYAISNGMLRRRRQITSVRKIQALLNTCPNGSAVAKARRALRDVANAARSPMEWKCYMLMTLSALNGGEGLPAPILNARLPLKTPISTHDRYGYPIQLSSLECDMVWPQAKVVVEYQGREWHTAENAIERDATKNNRLVSQGIVLFELTNAIVQDNDALCQLCASIRKELHIRRRVRTPKAPEAQRALRKTILPADWLERALLEKLKNANTRNEKRRMRSKSQFRPANR